MKSAGWELYVTDVSDVCHVVPVDDFFDHTTALGRCPCRAVHKMLDTGSLLVTHNAWDGREIWEGEFFDTL